MECPFCNINSEKTRIVKDKEFVRVIFSNPRLMSGHLLIVPKRHVEKTSELNEEEQKETSMRRIALKKLETYLQEIF